MSKRDDLRGSRTGTVINVDSSKMENKLTAALIEVRKNLPIQIQKRIEHDQSVYINKIAEQLGESYPDLEIDFNFQNTFLKPDGGIIYVNGRSGRKHVLLISEAKRQGTNNLRAEEGLPKQAKGNAIERLGKNVIGFRMWLSSESIFPFVVFGEGVDFASDSSILDRVSTIAMFAPLNTIEVRNVGPKSQFGRGSFFFRVEAWTQPEMVAILEKVIAESIKYYQEKYGKDEFN
jgi:type II restriction enzyme